MKTVKKLFSLLLVAVLLVSAIPFQASASTQGTTTPTEYAVNFKDQNGNSIQRIVCTNMTVTPPAHPAVSGMVADGWVINGKIVRTNPIVLGEGDFVQNSLGTAFIVNATANYKQDTTHTHSYGANARKEVTPATCTEQGYTTVYCDNADGFAPNCTQTQIQDYTTALGHDFDEWFEVTAPGEGVAGQKRRDCKVCDYYETDEIDALPIPTTLVSFIDNEGGSATQYRNWPANYTVADLPRCDDLPGRRFIGWYTRDVASGSQLVAGQRWDGTTTYYARYIDDVNSTATEVTVYARFFSGGVKQSDMYLGKLTLQRYDNLLTALNGNRETFTDRIFGVYDPYDYEVTDGFYMNVSDSIVTNSTQVVSGNTSVYIRVNAKNSAAAKVLLYVHNKAGEAAVRLYDMPGYVAGNTVNTTAVQNFLKAQTGKTYTVAGMYEQSAWDQLVAGYKADAVTTVTVPASGTLQIHVVLSNYSSSGSVTTKPADSTNPSTGDAIMATAGIMALSAAAFVTLTQLRKRKMI